MTMSFYIPTGLPSLVHEILVTCPKFKTFFTHLCLLTISLCQGFPSSYKTSPVTHLLYLQMHIYLVPWARSSTPL